MNQNNQDSHKRYLTVHKYLTAVLPVLALVIAVTTFAALMNDFDSVIGHFARGSVTWIISVAAACAAVLLSAAGSLVSRKTASLVSDPGENPVTVFGAVLCCILGFVCMASYAADYSLGILNKFAVVFAVLVPFIGISMVLSLIGRVRFSALRKVTALLAAAAVNVSLFADYFDFTLPLNSPIRNFMTVVKCAVLLYLLSEARFSFGAASKRLNLTATVLAAGVTASAALGFSAGALFGRLFSSAASSACPSSAELALFAAVGIHAAGRMFSMIPSIGRYIPPETENKKKSGESAAENTNK